jgi:hypothetical protein
VKHAKQDADTGVSGAMDFLARAARNSLWRSGLANFRAEAGLVSRRRHPRPSILGALEQQRWGDVREEAAMS